MGNDREKKKKTLKTKPYILSEYKSEFKFFMEA